jgi:hypothetical protein
MENKPAALRTSRIRTGSEMGRLVVVVALAASALMAMAASGCVREEIGPTNFHTTAYIERSADEEQAGANATPPSVSDDSNSSSTPSHH